jgi:hypothetical protein
MKDAASLNVKRHSSARSFLVAQSALNVSVEEVAPGSIVQCVDQIRRPIQMTVNLSAQLAGEIMLSQ